MQKENIIMKGWMMQENIINGMMQKGGHRREG